MPKSAQTEIVPQYVLSERKGSDSDILAALADVLVSMHLNRRRPAEQPEPARPEQSL